MKCVKYGNYSAAPRFFKPDWRIVLDHPEDLELLKAIAKKINKLNFGIEEVFDILKKCPDLFELNKNCTAKIPGAEEIK
jgi:spore coat polysaccharide biosynthesis protein SpsF (cytidylyltransferase family)